jgi:cytochrome c oxidase cbb3-type subunit 3
VSDFTSDGWGFYVTIVTLASIAGCAVLLFALGRMRVTRSKTGGPVETTGHVWDGDLAEYNNPLPRWWMWLFYATIVFALAYLVLYPGLGRAPGALGWTSAGAYVSEVKAQDEKVQPLYAKYRAMDVKAVAADAEARAMGERLFLNYCAQCHGSDAGGSKGFPSLRDTTGSTAVIPRRSARASSTAATASCRRSAPCSATRVCATSSRTCAAARGSRPTRCARQLGKPLFAQNCAACHGADRQGHISRSARRILPTRSGSMAAPRRRSPSLSRRVAAKRRP